MAQTSQPKETPFFNKVMMTVLRSPLHGMVSKGIMVITFTGRKSGRLISTPVSYLREGQKVTFFTQSRWWKNLPHGTCLTMQIASKTFAGRITLITEDIQAVSVGLGHFFEMRPGDARFYKVTLDASGKADPQQLARAAQGVVMLQAEI